MENRIDAAEPTTAIQKTYEAPELKTIGEAADVVLGFPGGGADGPNGMSEPQFEFEADDQEF